MCFVVNSRTVVLPIGLAALFNIVISLSFIYRFDLFLVNANVDALIIELLFTLCDVQEKKSKNEVNILIRSQRSHPRRLKMRKVEGFEHRINDVCAKQFKHNSAVKQHIRINTGKRPYECDICSKEFKQNSALQEHIRIHIDETSYECDICSKQFKHNSALKQHIRIHTGERLYK